MMREGETGDFDDSDIDVDISQFDSYDEEEDLAEMRAEAMANDNSEGHLSEKGNTIDNISQVGFNKEDRNDDNIS